MQDYSRTYVRLINGRDWLRQMGESALDPCELWRIHCRHVNHNRFYLAPVVIELAAQRVRESYDGVLGRAICRL
jgi:hypothetical protein